MQCAVCSVKCVVCSARPPARKTDVVRLGAAEVCSVKSVECSNVEFPLPRPGSIVDRCGDSRPYLPCLTLLFQTTSRTTPISTAACRCPMGGSGSTPLPPILPVGRCTSVNGSNRKQDSLPKKIVFAGQVSLLNLVTRRLRVLDPQCSVSQCSLQDILYQ